MREFEYPDLYSFVSSSFRWRIIYLFSYQRIFQRPYYEPTTFDRKATQHSPRGIMQATLKLTTFFSPSWGFLCHLNGLLGETEREREIELGGGGRSGHTSSYLSLQYKLLTSFVFFLLFLSHLYASRIPNLLPRYVKLHLRRCTHVLKTRRN